MNDNSQAESSLPACEMRLQLLRCQLEAHRQAVENKKTNLVALNKLVRALLRDMDVYGDDYIPKKCLDLYRKADVDDNTFDRSFGSMNGVILCVKIQIIKDIDESVLGPFGVYSYEGAINRLFDSLAQDPEAGESDFNARMRFALRRFSDDFWEMALHRFHPVVVKDIDEYGFGTKEMVYSRFVMCLRSVLARWSRLSFSSQYSAECITLLGTLVGLETRRFKELDAALIPLSPIGITI